MLHIHNGDSTAATAGKCDLPGEHLTWREALICGPVPGNLSKEEFRELRARHLADAYGVDLAECRKELGEQEEALAQFSEHEELPIAHLSLAQRNPPIIQRSCG